MSGESLQKANVITFLARVPISGEIFVERPANKTNGFESFVSENLEVLEILRTGSKTAVFSIGRKGTFRTFVTNLWPKIENEPEKMHF